MVDTVTCTEAVKWTAIDDSGEITNRPVKVGNR
jgi:hypothetical protein